MGFVTFPSCDASMMRACVRHGFCHTRSCGATLTCLEAKGFVSLINREGVMQKTSLWPVPLAPPDLATAATQEHGNN